MFAKKGVPDKIEEKEITALGDSMAVVDVMVDVGFCKSKSDARRLIQQGGVSLGDERVIEIDHYIPVGSEFLLKVGKRKYVKIRLLAGIER
jgi:tyrosyl-tRNA synthetase